MDIASIDWSRYAYGQYATDKTYLCNSLMIFEALERFGSKAARFLMYPASWTIQDWIGSSESYLLQKARDEYNVSLVPVAIQQREGDFDPWSSSFTKLLAFNQTQYDRIVMLDSDTTLLRSLDELFFLPNVPAAMPLAYWLKKPHLTSHIMLITPSETEFARVSTAVKRARAGEYDMDIVNKLYSKDCILLDHKKYALLTGEFREKDHQKYFYGSIPVGGWDPMKALRYASFVHFSDYPIPKPWLEPRRDVFIKMQPECVTDERTQVDCTARDIWLEIYRDFRERKEVSAKRLTSHDL
ncbi:nucleotide-diphospho-sugar transferase [Xylogone sp. PMI_703]|nr:nucleotide-diphospho-sugar transferase [Xylogone sp. PMI_703]